MTTSAKLDFCRNFVHLNRKLIRFEGRPYLPDIYASGARNLVIRASRQVEKSTFLVNTILFEAAVNPGTQILFVCPRDQQSRVFSHSRLLPSLEQSPMVRRALLGHSQQKSPIMSMRFVNGSQLFMRAAFRSADASRGISADLLLIDEFQDIAAGDLPVLQETMSHARRGRTILTGTPKLVENHLEAVFSQSTANEWSLSCAACQRPVILDERCLGPSCVTCPDCAGPLDFATGQWIPRNPQATWGEGYWINHLMVPWLNYDDILVRQQGYDPARFKNEVLGLPTTIGEHVVTRAELEACCRDRPMAKSLADISRSNRQNMIAGIDWGGGGRARTVVVVGFMRTDFVFEVSCFCAFRGDEDPDYVLSSVARVCNDFKVSWIAADGNGNGHVLNRLLWDRLQRPNGLTAIFYSAEGHEPRQDGILCKWTVHRSATIEALFARVKKGQFHFPRSQDCGSYLDEFACEVAQYDDINRSVRYSHPETLQDDALHATNYALLLGIRQFYAANDGRDT